jgi:ceramide glucosyltransferase
MDSECTNVIRKIKEEHPQIPTHIVCQTSKNVLNPKIEVLASMESTCTGELVWVSDSNVRVEPDTLKKLVHEYVVNDAKIVFSPIRGTGSCTVGSVMENASINLFVSGSIIAAYKLSGQHIIVGKSMLIEKKSLDTFGGFSHFREYLAEDFLMGEIFTAHKIYISSNFTWITNYNSHTSIGGFFSRMSRWAKMRFHIRKWVYILEILTNPVALAALSLVFLGADGLGLLGLAVVFKIFIEYADLFFVNPEDGKKWWVVAGYPLWVVIKDLIVFFVYCAPFFSSRVNWRGRIIRIGKASRIHLSS